MSQPDSIAQHQKICDELYELAREESRFLQTEKRTPEFSLLDRKRALLAQLDTSLEALRSVNRAGPGKGAALEKARSRIMQVLQLTKENEQLLLRYSLSRSPAAEAAPAPAVSASQLDKIYARHP